MADWALNDFIGNLGDDEPTEIAPGGAGTRELVSPSNRPASTGNGDRRGYGLAAMRSETELVARTPPGGRNHALNTAAFNLASLVAAGQLTEDEVWDGLTTVALAAGLTATETAATIRSGFDGAAAKVGARQIPERATEASGRVEIAIVKDVGAPVEMGRRVVLVDADSVHDDVPTWAWTYGGKGRIQLGTLALFAGRPGAGKSTAARWFAAQASLGALDGIWSGQPQRVAYVAPAEESLRFTVKPGLRAAGADLSMIIFPQVHDEDREVRLLSILDEVALTTELVARGITVLVVDPLMSTIGANVDIHRNNEVRAYVEPWARIADAIGGIVVGVVHLRKESSGDLVAAITGSSAFGEIARAVFGFAKDPESDEGDRVLSQAKNSTGEEDLALTYRITGCEVLTDSGQQADVGRFEITGTSEVTVGDILTAVPHMDATGTGAEARAWLEDYLAENGPEPSKVVKAAGRKENYSERTLQRAAAKLRVVATSQGFPRATFWSLPPEQLRHQSREQEDRA